MSDAALYDIRNLMAQAVESVERMADAIENLGQRRADVADKEGPMTLQEKQQANAEFERVKERLTELGVPWYQHRPFIEFQGENGTCRIWPSQTHDGKLAVTFTGKNWASTADGALELCLGE